MRERERNRGWVGGRIMRGGVEERKREGVGPREGKRERGEMGRGREGKREGWWKGERKKRG